MLLSMLLAQSPAMKCPGKLKNANYREYNQISVISSVACELLCPFCHIITPTFMCDPHYVNCCCQGVSLKLLSEGCPLLFKRVVFVDS